MTPVLFQKISHICQLKGKHPLILAQMFPTGLVRDLIWYQPYQFISRKLMNYPCLNNFEGHIVTLIVEIAQHIQPLNTKQPYRIICYHGKQILEILFFQKKYNYLSKIFITGDKKIISGRLTKYNQKLQISHPDHILSSQEQLNFPDIEPVYSVKQGITSYQLWLYIKQALTQINTITEWLPDNILKEKNWTDCRTALTHIHQPEGNHYQEQFDRARQRLAFDEMFALQKSMVTLKHIMQKRPTPLIQPHKQNLIKNCLKHLKFTLTHEQNKVLTEIISDLQATNKGMNRLLLGDVGSGKTIIALLTSLFVVEAELQVCILAPTSILASQLYHNFTSHMQHNPDIKIALLTANHYHPYRKKSLLLQELTNSKINILIGTHALLENSIHFAKLGLVIIDEQHRFGVRQRQKLLEKGFNQQFPHSLMMSATPIPRTLLMSHYGYLDVSYIREKPPGRLPVKTAIMSLDKLPEIINHIKQALIEKQKIYWVCPLIDQSENNQITSVIERSNILSTHFPGKVCTLHGQMSDEEKRQTIEDFQSDRCQILVATTVIEVGIDIPDANIIIIEHSEYFGLAQLHQLRGRVGRNSKQAFCILIYTPHLSEEGQLRLQSMRNCQDGFKLAEIDLTLRGGGDLLGTLQTGFKNLTFFDPQQDEKLMDEAQRIALEQPINENISNSHPLSLINASYRS